MEGIAERIAEELQSFFGNPFLTVFFIAAIPMIEVRGAIPIATALQLNPFLAYAAAALGAFIVAPILYFLLKPLLKLLKKTQAFQKIALFFEDNFSGKAMRIEREAKEECENKNEKSEKKRILRTFLGVYLFVALPLPLTGVWTGTAVAAFTELKWYISLSAIFLGNLTASAIIALLAFILGDKAYIILIILAVFIVITLAAFILRAMKRRKAKQV